MAKKSVTLGAGIVAICLLFGAWYLLKDHNEKAELQEAEADAAESIVDISGWDVASFALRVGEDSFTFLSDEDGWTLEEDENFPVNPDELQSILSCFEPLEAVRRLEDIEDTGEFGMDDPSNVFSVKDSDGNEITITLGDSNEGTGDDYVMKDEDTSVIYTISSALRETVSGDLYDYAVSDEPDSFSSDSIVKLIVRQDGEGYELQKEEDTWTVTGKDGELDQDEVEAAVSALGYLSYSSYVDYYCTDDEKYGFDLGTEVIITWETETETATEDEETETEAAAEDDDAEAGDAEQHTLTIRIGDRDGDGNYYVQQEGSYQVHTLEASVLEDLLDLKI